jgi:hypothetical protein
MTFSHMDLPRHNGELTFEAPWQSRVFGLAAAVIAQAFGGDREPFRRQLIAAIAADPDRPYWESWTVALEALTERLPAVSAGRATDPGVAQSHPRRGSAARPT